MGKIIKNSSGQVVLSGDKALEVTAAIDSNIVAENIKKDVEILGVTGTYEGSGGGSAGTTLNFYTCEQVSYQSGGGHAEPITTVVFSATYQAMNSSVPVAIVIYDKNNAFGHNSYMIGTVGDSFMDTSFIGMNIQITSLTSTVATLTYRYPMQNQSFDATQYEVAPIYTINYSE